MSYTIEYKRIVFVEKPDKQKNDLWWDDLWAFTKHGDNNVYDQSGRRARDWDLYSHGSNATIIERVCELAGACEGGNLQLARGFDPHYVTPEHYLEIWRKAIKKAIPFEDMLNHLPIRSAYLIVHKTTELEKLEEYYRKAYEKMLTVFQPDGTWYDHCRYRLNIEKPDDLKVWNEYQTYKSWVYIRGIHVED